MFNSPFREAALAGRNQREQLDRLLRITAPHERIILAGIGLVLVAVAVWALFGSIVRSVTMDGVLIEPGTRHPAVTTESGHLVELLAAPGDRVGAGDPIARQSVPELDREAAALRDRMLILEAELEQSGGDGGALRPLLAAARTALLEMDARRAARELIVSPIGGEVMNLGSASGEFLPAGAAVAQVRDAVDRAPVAVLRVATRAARRIQPGMRASVEFTGPDGVERTLEGDVASVAEGPLPGWLAAMRPAVSQFVHRVDVTLRGDPELSVRDGTACRVRIVLGRHPPAALFSSERA